MVLMLPLDGITVVAVEQAVAAPLASRHLADLGARVIKVERPHTGDFARSYDATVRGLSANFVWLNRSKQSLTLDLKRIEAVNVLKQLLERADVFLHNLAPGAVERLGLGNAALRIQYPRLVMCEISGYGRSGPYEAKKAYDLLVQSEAGVLSVTGTAETPSKVGISVADIAAGMYAFSSILAALFARQRTGTGSVLEVSMFEALAEWMSYPAYYTAFGGTAPPRSGASHNAIAPYGPYEAGDGRMVYLGIQNDREWARFCTQVLERPDVAGDPRFDSNSRRVEHRPELDAIIRDTFQRFTADELVRRLEQAQIAVGRMNTVMEFVGHPQLASRGRWSEVSSPVGMLRLLKPPFNIEGFDTRAAAIPAVGEHTSDILRELGHDDATVAIWRQAGIV
jgi:crotonobetainyl-CoA:carnitine CoA-transferase CaiB-like acyl-CoA transferase